MEEWDGELWRGEVRTDRRWKDGIRDLDAMRRTFQVQCDRRTQSDLTEDT